MSVAVVSGRIVAPAFDVDGPRIRIGLAWAGLSLVAVAASPVTAAAVFTVLALAASGQAVSTWRGSRKPLRRLAIAGAAVLPLAAVFGPAAVGLAAAGVVVVTFLGFRMQIRGDTTTTLALALWIGAAAAAPVVVRTELGVTPAVVLLLLVHVHDASAFIVGSGAQNHWEGPAAGIASIAAVALAAAAVLAPPFSGVSPLVLGGMAAVLAPLGPYAGSMLIGTARRSVPALHRIDALLVFGPLWALAASVLLER